MKPQTVSTDGLPVAAQLALVTRGHIWLFALVILAALALRVWQISQATLDHYDEGVYAYSALAVAESFTRYPNQEVFSPPLYFTLAGLIARLLGIGPDRILLLVSAIFGTLTVVAAWWMSARWFGPAAGIGTAVLLALNTFHIVFSRSALTDVTFTFLFVCALALLASALARGSIPLAVAGGICTALAWYTKYHGWFALLIVGGALVPHVWSLRVRGENWRRPVMLWAAATGVAILCYLPYLTQLAGSSRGFQGMAGYYLTLIKSAWLTSLLHHVEMQMYFEGPLSRVAVPLAFLFALLFGPDRTAITWRTLGTLMVLSLVAAAIGSIGTAILCTLIALPLMMRPPIPVYVWVLLGWLTLWAIAAPFYEPYARLILPFTVAIFIAGGCGIARLTEWARAQKATNPAAAKPHVVLVATAVVIAIIVPLLRPSDVRPWHNGRGMRTAAAAMAQRIPAQATVVVVGEPAAGFYLKQSGVRFDPYRRVAALDTMQRTAYVVTGVYADRAPPLRKRFARLEERLTRLGTFEVRPYDARLLDDFDPTDARKYRRRPDKTFDLQLYLLAPSHGAPGP